MANQGLGFSALELLTGLAALCVAAMAVLRASHSAGNYRLHSEASPIASYPNVEQLRAAFQRAPKDEAPGNLREPCAVVAP